MALACESKILPHSRDVVGLEMVWVLQGGCAGESTRKSQSQTDSDLLLPLR